MIISSSSSSSSIAFPARAQETVRSLREQHGINPMDPASEEPAGFVLLLQKLSEHLRNPPT